MSDPMVPFHIEFQGDTQIIGRLIWAENAWDAIRLTREFPTGSVPIRATRLVPDRIFEYRLKERKA